MSKEKAKIISRIVRRISILSELPEENSRKHGSVASFDVNDHVVCIFLLDHDLQDSTDDSVKVFAGSSSFRARNHTREALRWRIVSRLG